MLYNIKTIDDLLERQPKPPSMIPMNEVLKQQQNPPEEVMALGTIRQIYRDLSVGTDPLSRRIYEQLHNNPVNMADNRQIGIERALNTPYAFIQESINNELAVDEHCELTHVKVESPNFPMAETHFEYGIIGQKYSTHLETINKAIRELKASGRLEELKRRYWNRKCNSGANSFEHYRSFLTACITTFSLFFSLFVLS
ncbi:hypothetical protein SSS_07454 [Sarcoptes scabiei]|nr:hypothetical protein SSS_07454 [Sarcoptes scabiei]